MIETRYLALALASSSLLLNGCGGHLLAKTMTGGSVEGLDKRISVALGEFDARNFSAAARDCADAYGDMQGKFQNSLLDRNNAQNVETFARLGVCSADANAMLQKKAEACKWYRKVNYATAASKFDPRRYCGV